MWRSALSIEYKLGSYLGKWKPQLRNYLLRICLWVCLSGIFFIATWFRRVQPTLGGTTLPGKWAWAVSYKGSWASKRNQTRKKSPSVASVSVPFSMFLSGVSALAALVSQINSFLLKLVVTSFFVCLFVWFFCLGQCFIRAFTANWMLPFNPYYYHHLNVNTQSFNQYFFKF